MHTGARAALHPEELLRSRYAAYAIGEASYIMKTTHPDHEEAKKPEAQWKAELALFARHTQFDSLDIQEQSYTEGDAQGSITFEAGITQNGQDASFKEKSDFVKQDGAWLYAAGDTFDEE